MKNYSKEEVVDRLTPHLHTIMDMSSFSDNIISWRGQIENGWIIEISIISDDCFYTGMPIYELLESKRLSYIDYNIWDENMDILEHNRYIKK